MYSTAARHGWDHEPDDSESERIVQFPASVRHTPRWSDQAFDSVEAAEPVVKRQRGRQAVASSDSLPRYVVTALGVFLAIGMLTFVLFQLGRLGRESSPPAGVRAVEPAQVLQAGSPQQPPAAAAPRPGEGPVRVRSRVLEPSYTVARGDTLGSIAARFGTTVEAVQSMNNLPDRNSLAIGQRLVIPNQD